MCGLPDPLISPNQQASPRLPSCTAVALLLSGLLLSGLLLGCGPSKESTDKSLNARTVSVPEPAIPTEAAKPPELPPISLAQLKADNRYVTSTACQDCHADQYSTWHASYHRTMTQDATPQTVRGNFDGQVIAVNGYPCVPIRQGYKFYMTLVHPAWDEQEVQAGRDPKENPQPPPITYAVDRVIGSHHQQVYLSRGPDGSYHTLPLVWLIHQKRWITRSADFLAEPRAGFYHKTKLWNNGCVFCHNTGPVPGLQQSVSPTGEAQFSWNTSVEELGIACEACHGPGGAHVELQQMLAARPKDVPAPAERLIVNPLKLNQEESVLTCGRCHGKMIAKSEFDRQCLVEGDFFRPGDWDFVNRYDHPTYAPGDPFREMQEGLYFWPDGTPRTTALEYQGVLLSACYQRGEMTCLSCHGMHGTDPNDQLLYGDDADAPVASQNKACTQCHSDFANPELLANHTHHAEASSGSVCYNCHMPFQAYSLLKRVRSHRISNPSAAVSAEAGIPNGCNQCHVDESLEWTNAWLAKWKGSAPNALQPFQPALAAAISSQTSSTVADALAGHALQRALSIEQLGDVVNFPVAGKDWRARILIESLADDYDANRLLAYQALRRLPGFEDFVFDYIGIPQQRAEQIQQAQTRWRNLASESTREKLNRVLGTHSDADSERLIKEILDQRNTVAIEVLE